MKLSQSLSLPLLTALLLGHAGTVRAFTNVIAFGDSLTDTGNAFAATGGVNPAAPYYMGRFSNGPNWLDSFAPSLGHDSTASALGGDNWAVGGATAGGTGNILGAQVGGFLPTVGGTADPMALYSVWIGGNDVIAALSSATPTMDLDAALAAAQTQLSNLFGAGATEFLIPNLPDLGATPGAISGGPGGVAIVTSLTQYWNTGLAWIISGLEASGATVYAPDIYTDSADLFANPTSYGFTNSTQGAFSVGAADPNDYVFVDNLHPSGPAHALLSGIIRASVVPEPSRGVLVFAGLMAMGLRRRR